MHFFTANIIDTNLLHDALCVRAQRERERERELGCLAWGQGSSNVDMSFVGER